MTDTFSGKDKKWYQLGQEETFEILNTRPQGLSSAEAALRLERFGPNELGGEEKTRLLKILLNLKEAIWRPCMNTGAATIKNYREPYVRKAEIAQLILLNQLYSLSGSRELIF